MSQSLATTDISENGESNAIRFLIERSLLNENSIFFDVGANVGEWTNSILQFFPNAEIYSFEPDPGVASKLDERFFDKEHVHVFSEALTKEEGVGEFHVYPSDRMSSLFMRDLRQVGIAEEKEVISVTLNTVDNHCRKHDIKHIHFLKIDVEGAENDVLRGADSILSHSRADFVQIEYGGTYKDAGETLEETFSILRGYGYEFFRIHPQGLIYLPKWQAKYEDYGYSNFIAIHERLVSLVVGKKPKMLKLEIFLNKYNVPLNGLIHVGAHEGEEIQSYQAMGVQKMLLVEANPSVYERLIGNLKGIKNCESVCCAASDSNGEVELHLTNMDQSSSILPLAKHKEIYPQIYMEDIVKVPSRTIDDLVNSSSLPKKDFNFLCLDIQGAELLALQGAKGVLPQLDGVLTEINYEELYEGAPGIEALDDILEEYGFFRVATTCPYHPSWGDALYLKQKRNLMFSNPFDLPGQVQTVNHGDQMLGIVQKLFKLVLKLHEEGKDDQAKVFLKQSIKNEQLLNAVIRLVEPMFLKVSRPNNEAIFISLLHQTFPSRFPIVMIMGKLMEKLGHQKMALDCFKFASQLNPGHGEPFTRSLLLQLPHRKIPEAISSDCRDVIGLPLLGKDGRFANQLFQYAYGKCYAEKFGLKLQTPDWIGRYLFGLDDDVVSGNLPGKHIENEAMDAFLNSKAPELVNTYIRGYFNQHSSSYAPFRDQIREMFKPIGMFADVAYKFKAWLHDFNVPVIVIHLRRGDFGNGKFWIAPDSWYLDWLETVFKESPEARLYIASDDLFSGIPYKKYSPIMLSDSGINLGGFNFFLDFIALSEADYVGISNSTFSFFASMLNSKASVFMRPDLDVEVMRAFDPWNSQVLLDEKREQI